MKSIIELAREAGLYVGTNLSGVMLVGHAKHDSLLIHLDIDDLTRFAALVRAQALEEAARLVEPSEEHRQDASCGYLGGTEGVELLDNCAAAIRALKEKK